MLEHIQFVVNNFIWTENSLCIKKWKIFFKFHFPTYIFQRRGRPSIDPGFIVGLNSNGKYVCWNGTCRNEYNSPSQLLMHQYEQGHLDYLCCVCNRAFSRKDILRRHVKSLHLKEHFQCSQCTEVRKFNRKDHYRSHQLKVHGTVLCEECGAGFRETKSLKHHIIIEHTNNTEN